MSKRKAAAVTAAGLAVSPVAIIILILALMVLAPFIVAIGLPLLMLVGMAKVLVDSTRI